MPFCISSLSIVVSSWFSATVACHWFKTLPMSMSFHSRGYHSGERLWFHNIPQLCSSPTRVGIVIYGLVVMKTQTCCRTPFPSLGHAEIVPNTTDTYGHERADDGLHLTSEISGLAASRTDVKHGEVKTAQTKSKNDTDLCQTVTVSFLSHSSATNLQEDLHQCDILLQHTIAQL